MMFEMQIKAGFGRQCVSCLIVMSFLVLFCRRSDDQMTNF